jgi:hypothetical protein
MLQSFHNTISSNGQQLIDFEQKAKSQEELILSVFRFALRPLAWSDVKELLIQDMNEVSIKRSITNLYKSGELIKTGTMVKGIYGKNCHQYKLR